MQGSEYIIRYICPSEAPPGIETIDGQVCSLADDWHSDSYTGNLIMHTITFVKLRSLHF